MRVRKMDADGDYVFGGGQAALWRDVPDGVAQVVETRLCLNLGEWFLDPTEGMPWDTEVLGKYTSATRDPAIRRRILDTPGVNELLNYSSFLDRDGRHFGVQAQIDTIFGGPAGINVADIRAQHLYAPRKITASDGRTITASDGSPITSSTGR